MNVLKKLLEPSDDFIKLAIMEIETRLENTPERRKGTVRPSSSMPWNGRKSKLLKWLWNSR